MNWSFKWFMRRQCALCPWSFQCPTESGRILCRACESRRFLPPTKPAEVRVDG